KDLRSAASSAWDVTSTWESNTTQNAGTPVWTSSGFTVNSTLVSGGVIEITNGRTVSTTSTGNGGRIVIDSGGTMDLGSTWTINSNLVKATYTNAQGVADNADLIVAGTVSHSGAAMNLAAGATCIVESNGWINGGSGAPSSAVGLGTGSVL